MSRRPLIASAVLSLAVLATAVVVTPATASGTCTPDQLPAVYPEDQLQIGDKAAGLTTILGRTPQTFHAEILGILPDAILPGHDVILVKLSGQTMTQTGGAFYGMSGSPVYLNNELVGAIAYGPPGDYGDQTIAGVTPAQDMLDVLSYPLAGGSAPSSPTSPIRLTSSERTTAARAAGVTATDIPPQLETLRTPFAVSGLAPARFGKLRKIMAKLGIPVVLYQAGKAPAPTALASQPLTPGQPIAAVVAYGDFSAAAIGTLTATCGDQNLMFGHPFFWDGKTAMGMNGADVLTVVQDPSALIGPYMVANIDETHGTIDQDRTSALRGTEGVLPPSAPVTSHVLNTDTGLVRDGETDVVKQNTVGESLFAYYAPFSVIAEQDSAFDALPTYGSDRVAWTLKGTTGTGKTWSLTRADTTWDPYDASFTGGFGLIDAISEISFRFPDVTFTSLHTDSTITTNRLTTSIGQVAWSSPRHPGYTTNQRIVVGRGQRLRLKIQFRPFGQVTTETKTMSLLVPAKARDGSLVVRGGQPSFSGGGSTLPALLKRIAGAEHANDLVAQLSVGGGGATKKTITGTRVVRGHRFFRVAIVGTGGSATATP